MDASCALGTVRPRWDDLSDIPGATRQIQYQRPTPYDAFLYDDVAKGVKTFRGGYEPRSTKFEKIDIGKLPEVPFRRSIPSNPLAGFIPYGPVHPSCPTVIIMKPPPPRLSSVIQAPRTFSPYAATTHVFAFNLRLDRGKYAAFHWVWTMDETDDSRLKFLA